MHRVTPKDYRAIRIRIAPQSLTIGTECFISTATEGLNALVINLKTAMSYIMTWQGTHEDNNEKGGHPP